MLRSCSCVTNRIPVAEGYEIDFEDRFRKRVHLVDQAKGFIRNEVHRPRPMKLDHQTGEWTPGPAGFWVLRSEDLVGVVR